MLRHHRSYWIAVAIVVALALVAIETAGQSIGEQGVFEGRPALAGAQDGLGVQAGPPQGGIGLQGSQGAQLNLKPPRNVREQAQNMPQGPVDPEVTARIEQDRVLPKAVDRELTPAQARAEVRMAARESRVIVQ